MHFTNLNPAIFLKIQEKTIEQNYSISRNWKCWKFWFTKDFGVALTKHKDYTKDDLWTVVAIARKDKVTYIIDDPWMNVEYKEIFEYINLITELKAEDV